MDIPIARVVRNESSGLYVECPYCDETHRHGPGRSDGPDFGHRAAHCSGVEHRPNKIRGYYVREVEP